MPYISLEWWEYKEWDVSRTKSGERTKTKEEEKREQRNFEWSSWKLNIDVHQCDSGSCQQISSYETKWCVERIKKDFISKV